MKRLLDVLAAGAALVLLSPLFVAASIAILAESGRPVLFRQTRVGLHGREFALYKFRSMAVGADRAGPYFTATNDSRITRVGALLRRFSVDELPQLLNVLRGDMSLVGPRPDLPVQRSLYSEAEWAERCSVPPGITGLAQAELRSEATPEQRLALDLRYVREHDLWLDLRILGRTALRLHGKGAN